MAQLTRWGDTNGDGDECVHPDIARLLGKGTLSLGDRVRIVGEYADLFPAYGYVTALPDESDPNLYGVGGRSWSMWFELDELVKVG